MKTSINAIRNLLLSLATLSSIVTLRAQAPVNDDFTNATVIPFLPYATTEDTRFATIATNDPFCGGRGTTVWFRFIPTETVGIEANTFGSDYDTTLSVYSGQTRPLSQILCNDDSDSGSQSQAFFTAVAGNTYHFLVGSFSGGSGGNLVFSVNPTATNIPPIELSVTAAPRARINPSDGTVTVSCTTTSSRPVLVTLRGTVAQKRGNITVLGFFGAFFPCEANVPITVNSVAISQSYLFHGRASGAFTSGTALLSIDGQAVDANTSETASTVFSGDVQLTGKKQ